MPTPSPDSLKQTIDYGGFLHKSFTDSIPLFVEPLYVFWYIWIFLFLLIMARIIYWLYKHYIYSKAKISEIDNMSEADFDLFMSGLFSRLGYAVENSGGVGDLGIDFVIEKDGERCAVQAKKYKKYVGVETVQDVIGNLASRYCKKGMVVSNKYFSKDAKKLAKKNNIELWDRDILVKNILKKQAK